MEAQNLGVQGNFQVADNTGRQGGWQCPIKFGSPEDWLLRRCLEGYKPAPDVIFVAHYAATTRENPVQID